MNKKIIERDMKSNMKQVPARFLMAVMVMCFMSLTAWADAFKVTKLVGKPQFRPKGQLKAVIVKLNDELTAGGRIKMKNGEFMTLSTPMGDTLDLSDKTYMRLEAISSGDGQGKTTVKVALFQGLATNKVNKLSEGSVYAVRTPTAVAGVRGTEFQCEVAEDGETEVVVFEGEVEVENSDGEAVSVSTGEKAKVKSSGSVGVTAASPSDKKGGAPAGESEDKAESGASNGGNSGESNDSEGPEESEESPDLEMEDPEIDEIIEAAVEEAIEESLDFNETIEEALGESIEANLETINR
jgi:nitrogen fixation protein